MTYNPFTPQEVNSGQWATLPRHRRRAHARWLHRTDPAYGASFRENWVLLKRDVAAKLANPEANIRPY